MTEIVFLVEEDAESGYTARALGEAIYTQAENLAELREEVLLVFEFLQRHGTVDFHQVLVLGLVEGQTVPL